MSFLRTASASAAVTPSLLRTAMGGALRRNLVVASSRCYSVQHSTINPNELSKEDFNMTR